MAKLESNRPVSASTIKPKNSAFAALRHRDFRLLWLGQIVSVTGSQMQFVAINWHVYLLTKSAFALGLVGCSVVFPLFYARLRAASLLMQLTEKD